LYNNFTILGLVTARAGSKGLPNKNILPLLGTPLIGWTINQAIDSKYLDKIVVSTDSKEIAEISKSFGAEVPFLRPDYLATDEATSIDVINHTLKLLKDDKQYFDYLALLEPTSPLRETSDIDLAIEQLIGASSNATSIVAVSEVEVSHPMFCVQVDKNNYIHPLKKNYVNQVRRQELEKIYFFAGVIYVSRTIDFTKYKGFNHKNTIAYKIPKWKSTEIDDIYDFVNVEAILNYRESIK